MRTLTTIAVVVVILGALNWLLVGLFAFDLIAGVFANGYGTLSATSRVIYGLVGVAGLWLLFAALPRASARSIS